MSGWDESDTGYEDFDPNKDYSVQVQKNDGGLSSTQVSLSLMILKNNFHSELFKKLRNPKK